MKYPISKMNRTVELHDNLVTEYLKYSDLLEYSFSIAIRTKYGHTPTKEEASDEVLSELCNEVLLTELKALTLLPKAVNVIEQNYAEIQNAAKQGKILTYNLQKENSDE